MSHATYYLEEGGSIYTAEIRAYVNEELRFHEEELARLVAASQQTISERITAQALQPILQGIEGVIDELQSLYDRCCEKFPFAEADGEPDPCLAHMRELIRDWHIVWEGWNMPIQ